MHFSSSVNQSWQVGKRHAVSETQCIHYEGHRILFFREARWGKGDNLRCRSLGWELEAGWRNALACKSSGQQEVDLVPGRDRAKGGFSLLVNQHTQRLKCLSHLCVHSMCKFVVPVTNPLSHLFVQECLMTGILQKQRHFRIAAERWLWLRLYHFWKTNLIKSACAAAVFFHLFSLPPETRIIVSFITL